MKSLSSVLLVMLAGRAQAAVDVTGFTVDEASLPYGLIVMALVMSGVALATLRRAS